MPINFYEFDCDGDLLLLFTALPGYEGEIDSPLDTVVSKGHVCSPVSSDSDIGRPDQSEKGTESPSEVHMLVQSRALMLVSPVFKAMLRNGAFQEGNTLYSTGKLSIPLPDDNPDAFRILMEIVHHRNRQVPKSVSLGVLTQLAILIDKYQMLETAEPFVDLWVACDEIRSSLPNKSYATNAYSTELLPWLCVSLVFNLPAEFNLVTGMLMRHSPFPVKACFHEQELPIPGVVIDTIEKTRQSVISIALSIVQETIKRYQGPGTNCNTRYDPQLKSSQSACDAQILGSLLRGSAAIGIWPPPEEPWLTTSWSIISTQLRAMDVRGLCDDYFQNTVQMQWRFRREPTYMESHGVKAHIWAEMGSLDKLVEGSDLAAFK